MPSTVLGKRTRSSDSALKAPLPRSKRQARADIFNDEDENPFYSKGSSPKVAQGGEPMQLDSFSDSKPTKRGHTGKNFTPSPVELRGHLDIITHSNDENAIPVQFPTPETPRHRDSLPKKVSITPRHRVTFTGKALTPSTPRTPSTPGAISTVYSQARLLFARSSEPGQLIGRDAERQELTGFVQTCVSTTSGGCTYVSGPPGTGKSAMVREITDKFETSPTLKKCYINCMSIKTSRDLCGKLGSLFEEIDVLEGDDVKILQGMFLPKKKSSTVYIIILDEIDHILTLDLEILYKLFEWSLQRSSRLILVGIANALDLTDRFLPRLKARNLKPQLLPFLPYTASQIKTVITERLKSLLPTDSPNPAYVPFLHPAAIELCSRKVSSQTGDLRKAFDICRRAIDLVEIDTKRMHEQGINEQILQESPSKKPLEENINLSSPVGRANKTRNISLAQSLATLTVETAPRASISHVNKITSTTFGNGSSQRLKTLNLQQKAALCALVALEKRKREAVANVLATPSKSRSAAPTVKALYDVYCTLCTRDSILHPLTSTEFRDVIGSLETLSLISAVDGKNGSFVGLTTPSKRGRKPGFGSGAGVGDEKRVGSCVAEREIAQAVEGLGAGILKSILSGQGLD